ncbi:AaceriAFR170Cp [[Ashbya] aceris (nom. inval.)]|nr:AaceriAFR170Cp [[Ashbya] aceris (nom. inval.)]
MKHTSKEELVGMLKLASRVLGILLFFNVACKLVKRHFFPYLYYWLMSSSDELYGVLWWQRFSSLEQLIWRLVDYIEINYDIEIANQA